MSPKVKNHIRIYSKPPGGAVFSYDNPSTTTLLGDSEHIDWASSVFVQAKIANGVRACAN